VTEKIDPHLRALLESSRGAESQRTVQVIVALSLPASDDDLHALRTRGLQVRSVIGDVLTGSASLSNVTRIAQHPSVVKIEASTPLYPE
jgi:hypothetical protein